MSSLRLLVFSPPKSEHLYKSKRINLTGRQKMLPPLLSLTHASTPLGFAFGVSAAGIPPPPLRFLIGWRKAL